MWFLWAMFIVVISLYTNFSIPHYRITRCILHFCMHVLFFYSLMFVPLCSVPLLWRQIKIKFLFAYRRVVRQVHAIAPQYVVVLMPLQPQTSELITQPLERRIIKRSCLINTRFTQAQKCFRSKKSVRWRAKYNRDVAVLNEKRKVHFASNVGLYASTTQPDLQQRKGFASHWVHLREKVQYKYACHVRKTLWASTGVFDSLRSA